MVSCHTRKAIRLTYASPIANCKRQLRIFPPDRRGAQSVLSLHWNCSPAPDDCREYYDEFHNRVLELRHARIETEFRLALSLTTTAGDGHAGRDDGQSATGVGAFVLPSALCDLTQEVRAAAHAVCPDAPAARQNIDASAERICAWAHRALRYTPGVTAFNTTASQALARGAGVCQDYSHLMIALCRAVAIPARYVSGYIPGEGIMHAWVEVLSGDHWQAWDPTHDCRLLSGSVFVACGRDYRDAEPLRGTYRGGQGRLEVRCHTHIVEE